MNLDGRVGQKQNAMKLIISIKTHKKHEAYYFNQDSTKT